jgi:fluoride exporter
MSAAAIWIGVAALGGLGAVARFLLDTTVAGRWRGQFPAGTFAVNITGTIALGLLVGLAPSTDAMRLAGTALIGSYTTFSTWMLEAERAAEEGEDRVAALNLALSLASGVAAAALGRAIGRAL